MIFCESSLDRDWYPPRRSESFFSSLLPWMASFVSLSWINLRMVSVLYYHYHPGVKKGEAYVESLDHDRYSVHIILSILL